MAVAVQCMYMRGAIFELTKKHGATTKRYDSVQQLFPTIKENVPLHRFNVIAARLVATMKRRWNGKLGRSEFLQRFSAERWKKIEQSPKKKTHSRTCCTGCTTLGKWHAAFPARTLQLKSLLKVGKKDVAKAATRAKEDPATALREMKQDWLNKTGRNLEDDLVMLPETSLARKPTKAERKQQLRQTTRKIVKEMKKKMDETAMESCLQDRQSFSAYKRQRGRASFESPTEKRARYASSTKKVKSYSPTKPEWDSEAVLDEARQWPKDKPMNWTAFARKHHIPGRNCGQVVKEFCRQNKVDVLQLEGRTEPRRPMRPRYLKFGCGVSFAVQKNISEIKEDIRQAVNEGR